MLDEKSGYEADADIDNDTELTKRKGIFSDNTRNLLFPAPANKKICPAETTLNKAPTDLKVKSKKQMALEWMSSESLESTSTHSNRT